MVLTATAKKRQILGTLHLSVDDVTTIEHNILTRNVTRNDKQLLKKRLLQPEQEVCLYFKIFTLDPFIFHKQ